MIRILVVVALLLAVALGSHAALVALLAWQAWDIEVARRELFARQEEAALARLRDYWQSLTGKGGPS